MAENIAPPNALEMDDPPAQDSPNHILNSLNNDCIQEIMRRLKTLADILNAAEVCTCFQKNAKQYCSSFFKSLRIDDTAVGPHILTLDRVPSFLQIFGHLIRSIKWNFTRDHELDEQTLNTIAKYCGKTLIELSIHGHKLNFDTSLKFHALEKMELYDSEVTHFSALSQLKSLKLTFIKIKHCDWLAQEFPQLEEAKFNAFHKLRNRMLMEFLRLNPQLQSLELHCCRHISSSIFEDIGKRTPNLVNLCINPCKGIQKTFDENVIHLSALRKLKSLRIECQKFSGRALIDSLAEHQVPIEDLTIFGGRFDPNNQIVRDFSESIPKLTMIRKLTLSFIFDEMLIKFAKELENLREINVFRDADVTPWAIQEALKHGKQLKWLLIHFDEISLDSIDYDLILTRATGQTHVELYYREGSIEVDDDVLIQNSKWLKIEKY